MSMKNFQLFVGVVLASALVVKLSKPKAKVSASPSVPNTGIIYKCDSIKLVDKDKFKKFADDYIVKFFDKTPLQDFKAPIFIGEFIQSINKDCYKKFIAGELNKNERIIMLAFIWYFEFEIPKILFGGDVYSPEWQPADEVVQKNAQIWTEVNNLGDFKKAMVTDEIKQDKENLDWMESFWDFNGSKFPK